MFYLFMKSNQTVFHLSCARSMLQGIYQEYKNDEYSIAH